MTKFTKTEEVLIAAEASDEDGRITLVEFFIDGKKFDRNNTVPYEIEWKTLEEETSSVSTKTFFIPETAAPYDIYDTLIFPEDCRRYSFLSTA